ncbi:MAG: hypothetical protein LLG16_01195 [Euryarchaeota archaeon]|nr:hypothetical protein [Euryarchaeota archaeon]
MVVKRRPYDMIYLMTFEFALIVLLFYSAAALLLMAFGNSDEDLIANLGVDASDFLKDNGRLLTESFGAVMAVLTGLTAIETWGMFKRKGWAYPFGALLSVVTVLANSLAIVVFGFGDLQFALRLAICVVLPFLVIYYLRRPDIADYFLKR